MEYKKQHLVSKAFLEAWCDPSTPAGHEPYVWFISRDGKVKEKKAPKNILYEKDFYTIFEENGERNLDLEKRLSEIESNYITLRDKKLNTLQPLSDEEFVNLGEFVASSYVRTEHQKQGQAEIWGDYQDLLKAINPAADTTGIYHQADRLKTQPMPFFIDRFLREVIDQLLLMRLTIHHTSISPGFLTSDNPVIWIDPAVLIPGAPKTFFGVGSPTLNVIMPISPSMVITISHEYPEGYFSVEKPEFVDAVNGMIVGFSEVLLVSNTDDVKEEWFTNG